MGDMEHIRLAHILAVQAEIEGMKLRNEQVGVENVNEMGYPPDEFFKKAEQLKDLAFININQLTGNF